MANDQLDQPTPPQASAAGESKDVLFGWLVGRAAADLALAQALAASEAQRAAQFKTLEADLLAQIQELRNIPSPFLGNSDATPEFARLKTEMQNLLERMGGFEAAAERMQSTGGALESEMLARLEALPEDALARRIEPIIQNRFGELHTRLEQNARSTTRLAADHAALQAEMQNLSKKFDSGAAAPVVDFAAERERWSGELDERIAARLRDLAENIRQESRAIGDSKADRNSVAAEFAGLAERLTRIETAVDHASVAVGQELNSIKTELSRQQNQLQPAAELLQSVEEALRDKIATIQDYLGREQQNARTRELQQREFEIQLERLTQRLKEAESTVQQTHALVVNEGAQAAQQHETLTADLAALRAEMGEPQTRAVLDGVEESLRAKIHELQTQIAQNAAGIERRDAELRDLKAQIKTLAEQAARRESKPATPPFPLAERLLESAPALDLATEAPREHRPNAGPTLAAVPRETRSSAELKRGWEPALAEGQDRVQSLHERMSADIERARAELREKSGRWKLRR